MTRKQKITLSITGIVLVTLILVGLTYGYYLTTIKGNTSDKSITTSLANLELHYDDGNGNISATNLEPGSTIEKTFSVENTGNKKVVDYTVYLEKVINEFVDKNDLKITLKCESNQGTCNGNTLTYPSNDGIIAVNDIEVDEIQTFKLIVNFLETNDLQNDNMNKKFEGNVKILDIKSTNQKLVSNEGNDNVTVSSPQLLTNFKIYGNSLQENSTQSNNLCPDFSDNKWTFTNGAYLDNDGNLTLPNLESVASVKIPWNKKSKRFYIRFYLVAGNNYHISTEYYDSDGNKLSGNGNAAKEKNNNVEYNATFGGESTYGEAIGNSAYIIVNFIRSSSYASNEYKIKNVMISSENVEYEKFIPDKPSPEYPSEIKSVGDLITDTNDTNYGKYKIPIKATGKNLINISDFNIKFTNQYYINTATNLKLESGKNYTLSFNYNIKNATNTIGVGIGYGETYYKTDIIYNVNYSTQTVGKQSVTFTIPNGYTNNNYLYIRFVRTTELSDVDVDISSIQLEEGNTPTDYEPYSETNTNIYLNEPLRKIGNYSDYIDLINKKVIRNVYKGLFDGTESWTIAGTTNTNYQSFYTRKYLNNALVGQREALSNKFSNDFDKPIWSATSAYKIQTGLNDKVAYISLPKSIASDATQVKTFFSNNNTEYHFILATPKEETINIDDIELNENTKYFKVQTTNSPSNIEIEYIN